MASGNSFLQAIMDKKLKKADESVESRGRINTQTAGNDVQAILLRRMAMEMTDSEGEEGDSEDDWSDEEEED